MLADRSSALLVAGPQPLCSLANQSAGSPVALLPHSSQRTFGAATMSRPQHTQAPRPQPGTGAAHLLGLRLGANDLRHLVGHGMALERVPDVHRVRACGGGGERRGVGWGGGAARWGMPPAQVTLRIGPDATPSQVQAGLGALPGRRSWKAQPGACCNRGCSPKHATPPRSPASLNLAAASSTSGFHSRPAAARRIECSYLALPCCRAGEDAVVPPHKHARRATHPRVPCQPGRAAEAMRGLARRTRLGTPSCPDPPCTAPGPAPRPSR